MVSDYRLGSANRSRGIAASFIFACIGESLGGRGFVTVLSTIALQAPLDRVRGELPSDTRRSSAENLEVCNRYYGNAVKLHIASHQTLSPRVRVWLREGALKCPGLQTS